MVVTFTNRFFFIKQMIFHYDSELFYKQPLMILKIPLLLHR
jgi:hypothetical protein